MCRNSVAFMKASFNVDNDINRVIKERKLTVVTGLVLAVHSPIEYINVFKSLNVYIIMLSIRLMFLRF